VSAGPAVGPGVRVDPAVVDLMREVADLHHRVYRLTDGDDPDWATWYATWLVERSELSRLVGRTPIRSELIHLLVDLDREVAAGGGAEPWEEVYARRIVEQFA
jgi:hypothetical protein